MTAAYRFFDNDRVIFDDVFQPHIDATRQRIEEQPVVIKVQDTTEIDLTRPHLQVVGTGPMDGSSRRGIFTHLLHALTPDGTPSEGAGISPEGAVAAPQSAYEKKDPTWDKAVEVLRQRVSAGRR